MKTTLLLLCLLFGLSCAPPVGAQETQFQYLSGHDKDDAVPWNFLCSAASGMNVNRQTTIPVPSNWTLQGFGTYSYQGQKRPATQGRYSRAFTVPASWAGRRIVIVFEGVMTDTSVSVNGQSAGPMHQGGYYRFQYDITGLVKVGQQNQLAVTVDAESANASINNAERNGDYWNFEGIYRPVYLEAFPSQYIERVAVNARADGTFALDAYGGGVTNADTVEAQIQDLSGKSVGAPFTAPISSGTAATAHLQTTITAPRLWTAETPNLYQVAIRLKSGRVVLHEIHQKFGFRTVEVRPGAGLFVNGHHVLLKGSNRHSFWPDSGRCLSDKISRLDIALMKGLNMNAVRMSHYPPDQHFLDDCDEQGLYVLDELGGWQHPYDTTIGTELVKEMVVRDVNHPSILLWDNGNEGGWNKALDGQYAQWDPQGRLVNHPGGATRGSNINGIVDEHYPSYSAVQRDVADAGTSVYLPTEFLHGLFDGGGGAGLADYWNVIRKGRVSGGGFIWAFLDEGVKRVDQGGRIDVVGNAAPDGLFGPYREPEGSTLTVKEVWSPVVVTDGPTLPPGFTGTLHVENRYDFLDLKQCRFAWEMRRFRGPSDAQNGFTVLSQGATAPAASIPPGASGTLALRLPAGWRQDADALALRARDPQGRELWTWVWPLPHADTFRAATAVPAPGTRVTATDTADAVQIKNGDLTLAISKATGQLVSVGRAGRPYSLANGPRLVAGTATLTGLTHHTDGGDQVVTATYTGDMKTVTWRVRRSGWVQADWVYSISGPQDFFGVGFDYPEASVQSMRWLGDGPYRTYKNRRAGGTLNVWGNTYNDTVTGYAGWKYPEFKGYYGDVRWAQFQTTEGPITAVLGQDDLFLQVFTPSFVPSNLVARTVIAYPAAGLSFLNGIPPMGSKFARADTTGPAGQPNVASGDYHGSVSFYFGPLPR